MAGSAIEVRRARDLLMDLESSRNNPPENSILYTIVIVVSSIRYEYLPVGTVLVRYVVTLTTVRTVYSIYSFTLGHFCSCAGTQHAHFLLLVRSNA